MRRFATTLLTAVLSAMAAMGPAVSAAVAAESVAGTMPGLHESLYAVRLNAVDVSDGTVVLEDSDRRIFVDEVDVRAWRLRIRAEAVRATRGKQTFVRLDSLGALAISIDDGEQRLVITAPPSLFEESSVDVRRVVARATPRYERGAFLNYDLHGRLDSFGASAISTALESGVDLGGGVLVNSALAAMHPGRLSRLATTWQADDVRRDRSWQIGDAFVDEPAVGGNVRFAGFRISSNYNGRQDFVTSPQASVFGTAALPSTVDVYVNNVLALTQNVDPGVFRIENLPQIDGQGNVQLVVRDLLGRRETISRSYFGAATLLRPGLDQYEIAAGIARAQYGASDAYRGDLVSATERHGITDRFTGEIHAEGGSGVAQGSLAGSWLVPAVGNLTFGAGFSHGRSGSGSDVVVGDELAGDRTSYGFSLRLRSPTYADIGSANEGNASRSLAGHVGFRVGRHASIDLTYAATSSGGNPIGHVFTTAFGGSIGGMQIAIDAINPIGGGPRYLSLNVLTLLGRNSVSSTQTFQNGSATPNLAFQHGSTSQYGESYAVTATGGPAPYVEAHANGAAPSLDYQAGFASDGKQNEAEFDLRGAVADVGGHAYASRQILQSYGVAVLDGFPGVGVYVNNQLVGRTDREGRVLVPNLQAYRANAVTIDPQALPLTANVGDIKVYAAPYYRSPAIIRFKNFGDGGLVVPIAEVDGAPVAAGSVLVGRDGSEWPIADRGQTYVGGLTPRESVVLTVRRIDGTTCRIALEVPGDLTTVPTVATTTCR